MTVARVAITGYMHEVNAFAEPVGLDVGLQIGGAPGSLVGTWEAGGAIRRLRELRDVDIVELPIWEFGASGPLFDSDFTTMLNGIIDALRDAGRVDGVLVFGHGAGRTVVDLDSDSTFLSAIRTFIGPEVPIVVVLDFHANVSKAMCDLADVLVGYRTNPHVDIEERSIEAAEHLHRLLNGARTTVALARPPLVLPQLSQNTTEGEPLAAVRSEADALCVTPIRNISIFGGFSLGDVPDCGLSVVVTADNGEVDAARSAAVAVADAAWALRSRYRTTITSLHEAVDIARRAATGLRSPVILADTSDNPGGGAPGNSTFVLEALLAAGVSETVVGLQCDPAVVDQVWVAEPGAELDVTFNKGSTRPFARPLTVRARVLHLADGPVDVSVGVYRNSKRHPGRCCALDIGGIRVGVSSLKVQCADPDTLRHVGLDPAIARVVVVKSRGHFRAGFAALFSEDQIVEVGAPGVAPAVFDGVNLTRVPRPSFPFDPDVDWIPTATLHRVGAST